MIDSEDELRAGDRTAGDDGDQEDQDPGEDPGEREEAAAIGRCSGHVREASQRVENEQPGNTT